MRERHLLALTAVPFLVAALWPGLVPRPDLEAMSAGDEVTRFADADIVESSGLAVVGGLLVTTNDSGDSGRVFAVDPATGETVGVTHWSGDGEDPEDVEALAPAAHGQVWVGDLGDNRAGRDRVTVVRVPVGRGERTVTPPAYDLVYPDGPRDAESLLADPVTGRLYVVSKSILGGTLFAAPERLSADRPNRLTAVGPVLPIATDAAFFPDGRHLIVRNYSAAAVYSWPDLTVVGRFGLPAQRQGEGIAVAPDDTVYASSEGLHAPVLRIALPSAVRMAMAEPSTPPSDEATSSPIASPTPATTSPTPAPGNRVGKELPEAPPTERSPWGWVVGGLFGIAAIVVLVRSVRPR